MEDIVEENEILCDVLVETVPSSLFQHENSKMEKEIQTLITELLAAAAADNYLNDIISPQNDQNLMSETTQIESDACRHQKANLGKIFSVNRSQESLPKIPVRRYSSAESAFHKLTVNEQIQNQQHFSIQLSENLLDICESGSKNWIDPNIKPELVESEIVVNDSAIIIPDKYLPSPPRSEIQKKLTNTLHHPYKLTVKDKYINPPLPKPIFRDADVPLSQTVVSTPQILEPCQSASNHQPTKFCFPLQNSLDQDSPQDYDENLFGIYEGSNKKVAHSENEGILVESETIANGAARNIPDEDLSSIQRRDTEREQTDTSNPSYTLTVEDRYLNVYNIDRRDPPSPREVFKHGDILVSQTLMPTKPVLELCESTRNRRKKFCFPLQNSLDQDSPQDYDENLFGIYESSNKKVAHSENEGILLESETIANCAARNIPDEDLSSVQRRGTQREQTDTSNPPYTLTVEDRYINVYNIDRRSPPSPREVFKHGDILVSQTLVPTKPVLELCESTRNRRKKFYFPLEKSPDQDLPQGKLPLSKLVSK